MVGGKYLDMTCRSTRILFKLRFVKIVRKWHCVSAYRFCFSWVLPATCARPLRVAEVAAPSQRHRRRWTLRLAAAALSPRPIPSCCDPAFPQSGPWSRSCSQCVSGLCGIPGVGGVTRISVARRELKNGTGRCGKDDALLSGMRHFTCMLPVEVFQSRC